MSDQPEPTMVELFQYNHWANQELMAICMGLSDEMMVASNPGSYGSIRETFAHILKAEISFLKRIHGFTQNQTSVGKTIQVCLKWRHTKLH